MEWFSRCFKDAVDVPPKLFAMDASYAIISAVRTILPTSRLMLDAWHLDQNQRRNVATFARASRSVHTVSQMSKELCGIRNSSCEHTVQRHRDLFEAKYFNVEFPDGTGSVGPDNTSHDCDENVDAGEQAVDTIAAQSGMGQDTGQGKNIGSDNPTDHGEGPSHPCPSTDTRPRWYKLMYCIQMELGMSS